MKIPKMTSQKMAKSTEAQEHKQLVQWLKAQYPNIIFNTDMSGIKLPMGLAIKCASLRSHRAMPDLVIYEPRNDFSGLFIELKRTGEKLYNKKGQHKTPHLEEQFRVLSALRDRGYYAEFAVGIDHAKLIIDRYLKL